MKFAKAALIGTLVGLVGIGVVAMVRGADNPLPDNSHWVTFSIDSQGNIKQPQNQPFLYAINGEPNNIQSTTVVITHLTGSSTSSATSIVVTQLNGSDLANIASALAALRNSTATDNSNGTGIIFPGIPPFVPTTPPTNFTVSPANF